MKPSLLLCREETQPGNTTRKPATSLRHKLYLKESVGDITTIAEPKDMSETVTSMQLSLERHSLSGENVNNSHLPITLFHIEDNAPRVPSLRVENEVRLEHGNEFSPKVSTCKPTCMEISPKEITNQAMSDRGDMLGNCEEAMPDKAYLLENCEGIKITVPKEDKTVHSHCAGKGLLPCN